MEPWTEELENDGIPEPLDNDQEVNNELRITKPFHTKFEHTNLASHEPSNCSHVLLLRVQ